MKKFTHIFATTAVALAVATFATNSAGATEVNPEVPAVQEIAPRVIPGANFQANASIVHFANGNASASQGQVNAGARISVLSGPHGSNSRWRVSIGSQNGHNGWSGRVVYFNAAAFSHMRRI